MALPFYDPYKGSIGRFFAGDPSLAGYWQLNGNSSDNSGNSNNGTDTAVVYAPYANKFNQSNGGVFNGSTSFIQTNAFSGVGGNFTFSFWVYLNSYPNGASLLVYIPFVVGSTTPANSFDIQFRTDASGNPILLFEIYLNSGTNLEAASGVLPIKAKTWINFFATYNGSYANIYMNGKNIFNASYSGGYLNPTNTWIGRNGDYNQYYLNGNMCEVSLWKRALSQQEISDYYNWATTFKTKKFLIYQNLIIQLLTEAITNTDIFLRGIRRKFSEGIVNSDVYSNIKIIPVLFSEIVHSTITFLKTAGTKFSEGVVSADAFLRGIRRKFSEGIVNSDVVSSVLSLVVKFSESVKSTALLWINGMFQDLWWIKRIKGMAVWAKRTTGSVLWIERNKPQK